MYAKWIAEDCYVGPKFRRTLAIKNGEIRKVHAKASGKDEYILEGRNGKGFFGWTSGENIEILES